MLQKISNIKENNFEDKPKKNPGINGNKINNEDPFKFEEADDKEKSN